MAIGWRQHQKDLDAEKKNRRPGYGMDDEEKRLFTSWLKKQRNKEPFHWTRNVARHVAEFSEDMGNWEGYQNWLRKEIKRERTAKTAIMEPRSRRLDRLIEERNALMNCIAHYRKRVAAYKKNLYLERRTVVRRKTNRVDF